MKIENISLQNFKTFGAKPIKFSFNNLTSLIGENSVGKSNVLEALDLFFNFTKTKISTKSFHHNDYTQPIIITLKFKNLNADELKTFKSHLDDQNNLTITQYIIAFVKEEGIELNEALIEDIDFTESKHGDAPFNNPSYQYGIAKKIAKENENVVAVGVLRPGYTDNEGNKSKGKKGYATGDNYTKEVLASIHTLTVELKETYKPSKVILVGHSGGAAIAANLLAEYANAYTDAVLISCPCVQQPAKTFCCASLGIRCKNCSAALTTICK